MCKCSLLRLKRHTGGVTCRTARGLVEVRRYSEFQAGPTLYKPQRSGHVLSMSATRVCFTARAPEHSRGTGRLNGRATEEISLVLRHRQLHTASPNGCSPTEESALRFARTSVPAAEVCSPRGTYERASQLSGSLESMSSILLHPIPIRLLVQRHARRGDPDREGRWLIVAMGAVRCQLPKEVVGYANCNKRLSATDVIRQCGRHDALVHELQKYASLVIGSHAAIVATASGSTGPAGWNSRDWIWAMSQVHSRTFRVELEVPVAYGARVCNSRNREQTVRLLAPVADLLNHDSDPNECAASGAWNAWSGTTSVQTSERIWRLSRRLGIFERGARRSSHTASGPILTSSCTMVSSRRKTLSTARLCFARCRRPRWYARLCGHPQENDEACARESCCSRRN